MFDLDGTLTDPAEGICGSVRYALETLGEPVPELAVQKLFIGPPLNECFPELCGLSPEQTTKAIDAFRVYFAKTGIHQNLPYEGMDALLGSLRAQGRTLHVATTKPTHLALQVLDNFNMRQHFALVCGSGPAHAGRPKAEVVAEVLHAAGIAPADAVMVGDRRYDVEGAHQNGLPCVGVLFGYGGAAELAAAGAEHVAADVPELGRILAEYY